MKRILSIFIIIGILINSLSIKIFAYTNNKITIKENLVSNIGASSTKTLDDNLIDDQGITYVISENEATIQKGIDAEDVIIPDKVKVDNYVYKVTQINKYAFSNKDIKNLTLGKYINTIKERAFENCSKLENIIFNEGLKTIEDDAFIKCTSLTNITLPNSIENIGTTIFNKCNLKSIYLYTDNDVNMGVYAFAYSGYTTVYVKEINYLKIKNVSQYSLNIRVKVAYALNVNNVENGKVSVDNNRKLIVSGEEVTIYTIPDKGYGIESLTVNDEEIIENRVAYGEYTFTMPKNDVEINAVFGEKPWYTVIFKDYDDTILKEVDVESGEGVDPPDNPVREGYVFINWSKEYESIKEDSVIVAEYEKEALPKYKVTFKDYEGNVIDEQEIEEGGSAEAPEVPERLGYVFKKWNRKFDNVTKDIIVTALYEKSDVFEEISDDYVIQEKYSIVLDNNYCDDNGMKYELIESDDGEIKTATVTKGPSGFENIIVPNEVFSDGKAYEVTKIGSSAFKYCRNIQSIQLPYGLLEIENDAFNDCSLRSIDIPPTVKKIGEDAFYSCDNLTDIKLHEGLEKIGNAAFSYCRNIRTLIIPCSVKEIGVNTSIPWREINYGCENLRAIYINANEKLNSCNVSYDREKGMTIYVFDSNVEFFSDSPEYVDIVALFNVKAYKSDKGKINIKTNSGHKGEEILITVVPQDGYELESLMANDVDIIDNKNEVEGTYYFTMEEGDTLLSATYKEKQADDNNSSSNKVNSYDSRTLPILMILISLLTMGIIKKIKIDY